MSATRRVATVSDGRPDPRPRRKRGAVGRWHILKFWIGLLSLFLGPATVGIVGARIGGWRYFSAPEIGLNLSAAIIGVMVIRNAGALRTWSRRWISMLLIGSVLSACALGRIAVDTADWYVPMDGVEVTITGSEDYQFRVYNTVIRTGTGQTYSAPLLVRIPVMLGPAHLTIGHFSGHVLAVEQPRVP